MKRLCGTGIECLEVEATSRMMVVLPFSYSYGASLLHTHLRAGGSLVLGPGFRLPDKVLYLINRTNCTGFAGVPSHYLLLLQQSSAAKMTFPSLRQLQQAGGGLEVMDRRNALPDKNYVNMQIFSARVEYAMKEKANIRTGTILNFLY